MRVCAPSPARSHIAVVFTSRLRWLRITPFGAAVEPELYWMKATVSGPIAGGLHSTSPPRSSVSVATHRIVPSAGSCSMSGSRSARIAPVLSAISGVAFATNVVNWEEGRLSSGG